MFLQQRGRDSSEGVPTGEPSRVGSDFKADSVELPFQPGLIDVPSRLKNKTRQKPGNCFLRRGRDSSEGVPTGEPSTVDCDFNVNSVELPFQPSGWPYHHPISFKKQNPAKAGKLFLAEREGFEPSIPLRVYYLSRVARSTTPAPIRKIRL